MRRKNSARPLKGPPWYRIVHSGAEEEDEEGVVADAMIPTREEKQHQAAISRHRRRARERQGRGATRLLRGSFLDIRRK
jgi:hypothetical protein